MHDLISYHIPEAVKVYVRPVNENNEPLKDETGKILNLNQFSVDPQITNFSVLESIIIKAFNLNGDFILNYLNRSSNQYVQLKSDWDLECAYLGNAKPFLDIKVQKNCIGNLNDWDIVTTSDLNRVATYTSKQTTQLANNFLNKMEKMVFKAFNKTNQDLDENFNLPKLDLNNLLDKQDKKKSRRTNFDAFNLLSKIKRKTNSSNTDFQKESTKIDDNLASNFILNLTKTSLNSSDKNLNKKESSKNSLSRINSKSSTSSKQNKANQKNFLNSDNQVLCKILGKVNTSNTPLYEPFTEQQYLKYLHPDGRIRCLRELRLAIYKRGIEPSLRSTLWKHLLNVYPPNLTSEQRVRFIQQKAEQYHQLCITWQRNFFQSKVQQIHNQVRKDVLRTDRSHPFYTSKLNLDSEQTDDITSSVSTYSSIMTQLDFLNNESLNNSALPNYTSNQDYSSDTGADNQTSSGVYENRNIQALTNILTTYALNHKIGYWQGMSDLCSPLLLVIQNEADTYICFTALMQRLSANFTGDEQMANKFNLLRKLVQHYDPELFSYLKKQQASDLLFCYRWLLLELKREFKLDNALYMLEVSWAAMPPVFHQDLPMYDKKFTPEDCNITQNLTNNINVNDEKKETEVDCESFNSVKTLSSSLTKDKNKIIEPESFKISLIKEKLSENYSDLKEEASTSVSNLTEQITDSMSQMINGVTNAASEFYANFNNSKNKSNSLKSSLKSLKLASLEDASLFKREKFQQNSIGHNSISSLNDFQTNSDRRKEKNMNTLENSKNSSLNGSSHSLIEYNNTLNHILNRTQKMLKQQDKKPNQIKILNDNHLADASNKKNVIRKNSDVKIKSRHIRFLPKILSTDSYDNAIDSPEADELNEKFNFPYIFNKQFSIESVDSLEFNLAENKNSQNIILRNYIKQGLNPQKNLLKQQIKNSINHQQNHIHNLQQRSLPSSPLFKKKLDSFEHNFNVLVAEQHQNKPQLKALKSLNSSKNFSKINNSINLKSKLVSNHYFDSFDQHDYFVHCNGENVETNNNYNCNWKPERGLLNCFDSSSFDSTSFNQNSTNTLNNSINNQVLKNSEAQINNQKNEEKKLFCQNSNEEKLAEKKNLVKHTLSAGVEITPYQNSKCLNKNDQSMINELVEKNKPSKNTLNLFNSANYEKEEKSEGYCSGSISDRNSNYEEQLCNNAENNKFLRNTFSNSTSSLKLSESSSSKSPSITSSTSSISSSLSCSSSLVILSSNTSLRNKISKIEKCIGCLPSPNELNTGNAFMLFICLTILLQHREKIIKDQLDANEMAIYFDSYVRKHDVHLVLNTARELFQVYLNNWQDYNLLEMTDSSLLKTKTLLKEN